jgi:predicted transposase YdaD
MAETIYEDWFFDDVYIRDAEKKGEERGEKIGKKIGEKRGEKRAEKKALQSKVNLLVRQLTLRFGQLLQWAEARVRKAKDAQLEEWFDKVIAAPNLTEVLGAPDRQ